MIDVIADNVSLMLDLSIPDKGIALAKYMLAACHCASLLGSLMPAFIRRMIDDIREFPIH